MILFSLFIFVLNVGQNCFAQGGVERGELPSFAIISELGLFYCQPGTLGSPRPGALAQFTGEELQHPEHLSWFGPHAHFALGTETPEIDTHQTYVCEKTGN